MQTQELKSFAPSKRDQAKTVLARMLNECMLNESSLDEADVKALIGYVEDLERRAARSDRRRKSLRALHRAHGYLRLELALTRAQLLIEAGPSGLQFLLAYAKQTLWSKFRQEQSIEAKLFDNLYRGVRGARVDMPGYDKMRDEAIDAIYALRAGKERS
jgi:hypothetical protein